jgi:hypothetical protein
MLATRRSSSIDWLQRKESIHKVEKTGNRKHLEVSEEQLLATLGPAGGVERGRKQH